MDITPLINADQQIIQAYGEGRFRISGVVYEKPVIVLPAKVSDWPVAGSVKNLKAEDFEILAEQADALDVVLIGGGARHERPEGAVLAALKRRGLNIETMDTGAACRTYNVLMMEGRRVGAALIPV